MTNFRELNDQRVRQLAETLKRNGLAASETEAINMAKSMTATESRVNDVFNRKKDEVVMSTSRQRPLTSAPSMNTASTQPSDSREQEVLAQEVAAPAQQPAPHTNDAINQAISNVQQVYAQPQRIDLDLNEQDARPISELMQEESVGQVAPRVEQDVQEPVYQEPPTPSGSYEEEMRTPVNLEPQALETEPIPSNQQPQFDEAPVHHEKPVDQVVQEQGVQEVVEQAPPSIDSYQEPVTQQAPVLPQDSYQEPVSEQQPIASSQDEEELVEKTVEVTEKPPQRDTSSYAEAKVDLASVFRFKG